MSFRVFKLQLVPVLIDSSASFTAGKSVKFATKQYTTLGLPTTPTVARFLKLCICDGELL